MVRRAVAVILSLGLLLATPAIANANGFGGLSFNTRANLIGARITVPVINDNGGGAGVWIALTDGAYNIVQIGYWRCDARYANCDNRTHIMYAWGNSAPEAELHPPIAILKNAVTVGQSHGFVIRVTARTVEFLADGRTIGSVSRALMPWVGRPSMQMQIMKERWLSTANVGRASLSSIRPYFPASWVKYRDKSVRILTRNRMVLS